jgi:hypothetical protein
MNLFFFSSANASLRDKATRNEAQEITLKFVIFDLMS